MSVLFGLAGVLTDLLIQMFTVMAIASVAAVMVRGEPIDDWGFTLLFIGIAVGGLMLLARRIWRARREIWIARAGSAEVSTVTWLHFVFDALWIAAAVWMIKGAQAPLWDGGTRAAVVAVLVACVGLCALRVTVRVRAARGTTP